MILDPYILLPDEEIRYTSVTSRTGFKLIGQREIVAVGRLYLSNKRIVIISESGDYKSLNVLLSQVKSYLLGGSSGEGDRWWKTLLVGPNKFEILLVTSGDPGIGLQTNCQYKLVISFTDGGLYEFAQMFEKIYTGVVNGQKIEDQLPAYSE